MGGPEPSLHRESTDSLILFMSIYSSKALSDSSTVQPPSSSGSEGNVATVPIEAKNLDISVQNDNSGIDNDGLYYLHARIWEFVYVCM